MTSRERDLEFMRRAVEICRRGIAQGQSPFGAVVVDGRGLVAECHNTVWRDTDPTAHAEINALRAAAASLGTIRLTGCTLYSTCEPCPMCLAASHWARVDRVVFGASIADAQEAGFHELAVPARDLARLGSSPLVVEEGISRNDCVDLFRIWREAKKSVAY